MRAVPAGTLISSSLVARNCRSTLERREKSGMFRRSSTLIVTDRSFVWSRWYHAPHSRYAVRSVLRCPRRGERASRGLRGGAVDSRVPDSIFQVERVSPAYPGRRGRPSATILHDIGAEVDWSLA